MKSFEQNLYHPFTKSSLGFLQNERTLGGNVSEEENGFQIDNIDLYYQPVQEPTVGLAFFILRTCMVVMGEYIHVKVFKLMKEENHFETTMRRRIFFNESAN